MNAVSKEFVFVISTVDWTAFHDEFVPMKSMIEGSKVMNH